MKQGESIESINERVNDHNTVVKANNEVTTKRFDYFGQTILDVLDRLS